MADLKQRLAPLDGMEMPERWNDIRQRAPRAGFDPEPPRRQSTAVIALAVVLSVATVGWLASGFRDGNDEVASDAWVTTEVSTSGLRLDHPSSWSIVPFDSPVSNVGEIGIALSSEPLAWAHVQERPDGATGAWDMRDLPDDAVAVYVGVSATG